jgi:aspartokinase/homoserine dehydrogenase 1
MAGVTDSLLAAADLAAAKKEDYVEALQLLEERVLALWSELSGGEGGEVSEQIRSDSTALAEVLRGVFLAGVCPESSRDLVSGYGEIWSATILAGLLESKGESVRMLNAREVLRVEHSETGPGVLWEETHQRFNPWIEEEATDFIVLTGFVAVDADGAPTTLRRNGSDYSATIFARLLNARSVTIWTDVSGVMTADPRRVPEATLLPEISYDEAMELAYFGADVLHPQTMGPAVDGAIPIHIKNLDDPEAMGTSIRPYVAKAQAKSSPRCAVKGLSSVEGRALLSLEGSGMIGVPGVASRMFAALKEARVSVTMISQASSEHSICVAIAAEQGRLAHDVVAKEFHTELDRGQVQGVELTGPYSILAAVGDDMVRTPGVAACFLGSLAKAGINIRAIAQGSSERNISVVVDEAEAERALRSAHAGFYLSGQTISVGLIGPGHVGRELLRQFAQQRQHLHEDLHLDLQIRGICNSRKMLLSEMGLDLGSWEEQLEDRGLPFHMEAFVEHVQSSHLPHSAILDCSASAAVAANYANWLEKGVHVITPNKMANSASTKDFQRLREVCARGSSKFFYEATVGAGLPVISTVRDLLNTGDRIESIEGVLSGTLSFLFASLSAEKRFSEVVEEARQQGFTEPDPRADLSGLDVARKAVILARELGLTIELDCVPVEGLVPAELADCDDMDEFMSRLADYDHVIESRRAEAESRSELLSYVAKVSSSGECEVGLRSYPVGHPLVRIQPADNIFVITSERYFAKPMMIQGPGAGPAVTAAGVFGDFLRLAESLGGA